jgi:phage gp45-like
MDILNIYGIKHIGVDAVLILDIEYTKKGNRISIKKGTKIKVDMCRDIALIDNDHVQVEGSQYTVIAN